jgi:TolA-binding protein
MNRTCATAAAMVVAAPLLVGPLRADVFVVRDANGRSVVTGEVVRVTTQDVILKIAAGEIPVHRADIERMEVARPADVDKAIAALRAQQYADAVKLFKPAVDRYGGLDVAWVQDAVIGLGHAYLGAKDFVSAKKMFDAFKAVYPASPKVASTEVSMIRIQIEQKNYGPASEALHKILDPLRSKQALNDAEEYAMAEGLLLLGECDLAADKTDDALDDYLAVFTLFDADPSLSAEAKFKAAQIFEKLKKWKRAKGSYDDVVKNWPDSPFAPEARKHLAALTEAHPE